jgi:hypothetical protein
MVQRSLILSSHMRLAPLTHPAPLLARCYPVCFLTQAILGTSPELSPETVNAAVVGYDGALTASLQLLGPAVLHSYKHAPGSQGDPLELPPGRFGCPLGDDGTPLTGLPIKDASVNLFGTLTVKLGAGGMWSVGGGACAVLLRQQ